MGLSATNNDECQCVSCDTCAGSGTYWTQRGFYIGPHRRSDDPDEDIETCDQCRGSGLVEICDNCRDDFEDWH